MDFRLDYRIVQGKWLSIALLFAALFFMDARRCHASAPLGKADCEHGLSGIAPVETHLTEAQRLTLALVPGDGPAEVERFAAALNKADWSDPLLTPALAQARRVLRLALHAHRRGLITEGQFVSFCLRWGALKYAGEGSDLQIEMIEIVDAKGRLTPGGRALFKQFAPDEPRHQEYNSNIAEIETRTPSPGLTEEELANFEMKMAAVPRSEQFFWRVPFSHNSLLQRLPLATDVRYALFVDRDHSAVRYAYDDDGNGYVDRQLILSPATGAIVHTFGALEAYKQVVYKDWAVPLIPRLGNTSGMQIFEGIVSGGRVFAVPFPDIDVDLTVDRLYNAGEYYFSIHDWGHAATGSEYDPQLRRVLGVFGQKVLEWIEQLQQNRLQPEVLGLLRAKRTSSETALSSLADYLDSLNWFNGPRKRAVGEGAQGAAAFNSLIAAVLQTLNGSVYFEAGAVERLFLFDLDQRTATYERAWGQAFPPRDQWSLPTSVRRP